MKIKRWLSLLLTLTLCLGLLPGTTLATGVGTESSLPEGYEQMYVEDSGSYVTVAEGTAGSGGDIWLYGDANGTIKLNTTTTNSDNETVYENYNITCDQSIGEMGFGKNGTNWRKGNVKPGAEGYIYANPVSGSGAKYAIKAKINGNPNVIYDDKGNSEFTISAGKAQAFTFPPIIYVDGVSKQLTKDDFTSGAYTFACDSTIGTLFWHETYNELAINTTTATWGATGNITITNAVDSTKVYTCEVTANAPKLPFKIYDAATGGNEIAATTAGAYSIEYPLGEDKTIYLRMNDGETAVFTDAPFYSSTKIENDEELVFVSSELQNEGKVMAVTYYGTRTTSTTQTDPVKVGEDVYTISLTFTPVDTTPETGVYTTLTDGKLSGLLTKNGDLYTVSYTGGQALTLYYYDSKCTCTSEASCVEVTALGGGIYSISLKSGQSGSVTAGFSLKNGDQDAGGFRIEFTESTTNTFPAGYAQMYYQFETGRYATDIEVNLNSRTGLVGNLFADSNGTTNIDVSNYTFSFVGENLGTVVDNGGSWDTNSSATAGASGYLCADNGDDKYAIAVSIKAAASDENQNPPVLQNGVYTTLVDGQLGGFMETTRIYGEEGPWGYRISYISGQSVVVYYYNAENMPTSTSDSVTVAEVDGKDGVYSVTLSAGKSGDVIADIAVGNGGFPILFSDGTTGGNEGNEGGDNSGIEEEYVQMYYQFEPGSYATDIELSLGGSLSLEEENLFADAQGTVAITKSNGFTFSLSSEDLGHIVPPFDPKAWEADDSAKVGASGYLYAVKGEQKYAIAVSVIEQSGNQGGGVLTSERDITEGDKRDINWDEFTVSIDTITYKGVTYYVNSLRTFPGAVGALQPDGNGGGGGEITIGRCVGFYQSAAEGNITTPSDEMITELTNGFNGTLSLKLYAVTNPDSKYEIYRGYPKKFPATQTFDGFGKWSCGIAHQFSEGASGRWLIEITGTFTDEQNNTKAVKTQVLYTNEVAPSETYNATSLADANAKLADWAENGDSVTQYNLNLPEGELTGTLVIPEGERITFIRGHGKTTVIGGVYLDNAEVILQGINFVGAGKTVPSNGDHIWEHRGIMRGKGTAWRGHWAECYEVQWQKVWPEGHTNAGKPNYAVYGTGNAQIQLCSFTGYYHALHSAKDNYGDGVICGDMESTFRNNAVVYYLDGYYRGQANSDMLKSKFINNGCAFWVEGLSNRVPTGQYRFIACTFAYNQLDVVNLSGRWFFMPNNFFTGKGPDEADVVGPVFAQNAISRSANTEGESYVSAFPYASSIDFEELVYEKDAVMSSGNTQDYKIPEEELTGMTITIIDNDQEAAVWSFGN